MAGDVISSKKKQMKNERHQQQHLKKKKEKKKKHHTSFAVYIFNSPMSKFTLNKRENRRETNWGESFFTASLLRPACISIAQSRFTIELHSSSLLNLNHDTRSLLLVQLLLSLSLFASRFLFKYIQRKSKNNFASSPCLNNFFLCPLF